jgi:hypothetical protein
MGSGFSLWALFEDSLMAVEVVIVSLLVYTASLEFGW